LKTIALVALISCQFDQASASKLKLIHPTDLVNEFDYDIHGKKEKGVMKSSMANFGYYNYGTTIRGRLHYPIDNKDGCQPFEKHHFVEQHIEEGMNHGFKRGHKPIIMVDRGQCHFVKKAQNIQNFGAMMMLVRDNKKREDPEMLIMADDGRG
jgi:hypothetical protein